MKLEGKKEARGETREKVKYVIPPTSGFLVCSEDLMQLFLTKQAIINNDNNSRTINNNNDSRTINNNNDRRTINNNNSKNINSMTISNNNSRTINNNNDSRTIMVGL